MINKLCPMGKCYYKMMWGRARRTKIREAYGFYAKRRREQAIIVQNATTWKLRKMKRGHTSTLRDVSNAFPSPSHEEMDRMVDRVAKEEDRAIIKHRYKQSRMVIKEATGRKVVIKPRTGGLRGDGCMAEMFSAMYDPHVDRWIKRRRNEERIKLEAMDPVTGEIIQVGTTLFADDINETNVTENSEELDRVWAYSTEMLNEEIGPMGMAQNMDKAENIVCFMGTGATKETRKAEKRNDEKGKGITASKAKYLGNVKQAEGQTNANLKKRKNAMREGCNAYKGLWSKKGVQMKTKRTIFMGMVFNTGLAGMEAERPRWREIQEIDTMCMKLLKKMVGQEGSRETEYGRRGKTNKEIREMVGIPNMHSELRHRRLRWLQDIIKNEGENEQLRAAVFGQMTIEREGIGENPYMGQWVKDSQGIYDEIGKEEKVRERIENEGVIWMFDRWVMREFLRSDTKRMRKYEDERPGETEMEEQEPVAKERKRCGHIPENGQQCDYWGDEQGMGTHKLDAHGTHSNVFT